MVFKAVKMFPEPAPIFISAATAGKDPAIMRFVFRAAVRTANGMVLPVRIRFRGTRTNFPEAKPVCFASKTSFSITEKIAGGAPAMVIATFTISFKGGTMSYRVRIAERFKSQSAEQLVTMAGAVITGLTDNPDFPAPTVDLKTVQEAADDLNAALAAQAHGGTAATAEKKNKQEALIMLLRRLKHYVEDNCRNDLAVLLSSGFQAAATTRNRSPLLNPSILGIDFGNSTELMLKVTPIARAKCYEVRMAVVGAGSVPEPWQTAGLFTPSRIRIPDLVPGTTYMFQVRAVGGSNGYTDWSNPVSRMCA